MSEEISRMIISITLLVRSSVLGMEIGTEDKLLVEQAEEVKFEGDIPLEILEVGDTTQKPVPIEVVEENEVEKVVVVAVVEDEEIPQG